MIWFETLDLQHKYISLEQVIEGTRFRTDYGELGDLVDSILRFGLIQPIVIDQDNNLVAGGRRYRASKIAGLVYVPYHRFADCDELALREIELEENIRRKDMTWHEQSRLVAEIHRLKQEKYGAQIGRPAEGEEKGWGMRDTASAANLSLAMTSYVINGARLLEAMPELAEEPSLKNAIATVDRIIYEIERELAKRHSAATDAETVWLGDARELLKQVESESVDCVIIDPPWGTDLNVRGELHFDDSPEYALKFLSEIVPEIKRVMRPNAHFYCVFALRHYVEFRDLLRGVDLAPDPIPLIWSKPNSVGTVDWTRRYAPSYEPIFFYSSGERQLKSQRSNVFNFDPPTDRGNIAEKPSLLIRALLEQSTREGEVVLDCCCGSGVVPTTAKAMRRKYIACELDPEQYERTLEKLRNVDIDPEEEEPLAPAPRLDFVEDEEEMTI